MALTSTYGNNVDNQGTGGFLVLCVLSDVFIAEPVKSRDNMGLVDDVSMVLNRWHYSQAPGSERACTHNSGRQGDGSGSLGSKSPARRLPQV